jgi:hypothetical protein
MKKLFTICIVAILALCIGSLNAQNNASALKNVSAAERAIAQKAAEATVTTPVSSSFAAIGPVAMPSMLVPQEILNESFTSGTLPAGWLNLDVDGDTKKWQFELYGNVPPFPPMPCEGRTDAYSINSASYYNGVGALSPNNWLITPGLAFGTTTALTYWVKVIDPGYPADHYGVYVSTTGTNPSDFTLLFEETLTSAQADWVQRTVNITASGANCYIAFRHFNSYDQYIFCIDDIIVTTDGDVPDPCFPATNLNVEYAANCNTATLTWNAPAKSRSITLWDNTNINVPPSGNNGLISSYWSGNDNWVYSADDFDADGPWTIEKVYSQGFSNAPSPLPTKMSVAIFANDPANKPGTEIYRNDAINVADGGNPEIVLPTPFTLPGAGKYWIAIAGAYDATVTTTTQAANFRWNIYYGLTAIGSDFHLYDKQGMFGAGAATWINAANLLGDGSHSMYFKIEGTNDAPSDYLFNIYRDGTLIKENHNFTTYDDIAFDKTQGHTWDVKVICDGGILSDPVSKTLAACDPPLPPCEPVTNVNGVYDAEAKEVTITWSAPATLAPTKYEIYKDNAKVGESTTTQYADNVATLEPGDYSYEYCVLPVYAANVCEGAVVKACKEVEFTVGVGIKVFANNFSIVPNPANDNITITAKTEFSKIEIISFLGQTVLSQSNEKNIAKIDVSSLANGVYFVRISSENGVSVQKFVKQ